MDVLNLSIGEPELEPRRDVVALALDAAARRRSRAGRGGRKRLQRPGVGDGVLARELRHAAITVAAVELTGNAATSALHADFSAVGPSHDLAPAEARRRGSRGRRALLSSRRAGPF